MNKTIFILCLLVGIASASILDSLMAMIKKDPVKTVCDAVAKDNTFGKNIVNKLNNALAQGDAGQRFPLSAAYVSDVTNQNNFLAGGQTCQTFFNGLQTAFSNDLKNNGQTVADVRAKLIEFIKNKITELSKYIS